MPLPTIFVRIEWGDIRFSGSRKVFLKVSKFQGFKVLHVIHTSIVCSGVWFCHFVARSLRTLNAQIGMIMITSHNFQPRAPGRDASSGLKK